jgi:hypothetical protein
MVLPFHQVESHPKRLCVYLTNENFSENHFNCSSTTAAVRFELFSLSSAVIRERDITFLIYKH